MTTKTAEIVRSERGAMNPAELLQIAVTQNVSIETLTKLMELQERWEANQARRSFDESFAAFKKEAPKLEKSKEVTFGTNKASYKYTPLDVIANTLGPILAKHGLSYNWRQESTKESVTVTCILRHTQGQSIENQLSAAADPSGAKNAIQAIGSAVSYLRRYTLLGVLGMATSDEDTDGVTTMQAADWVAHLEEAESIEQLDQRYKEVLKEALRAQSPAAVKLVMEARKKRAMELADAA